MPEVSAKKMKSGFGLTKLMSEKQLIERKVFGERGAVGTVGNAPHFICGDIYVMPRSSESKNMAMSSF